MQLDSNNTFNQSAAVPLGISNGGLRLADCEIESAVAAGIAIQARATKSRSARNIRLHLGRPLRVMFLQTDMRIGGAEMVTANIIRRLDRELFAPELCCLKDRGALGEELAHEIPLHHNLLFSKYDFRVLYRLTGLLQEREIDAVITVGAGDKMFWGRLAARRAGVPVILSALHSTGWPDSVGRMNRMLTPLTDAFIAVADSHGEFLAKNLRISRDRVAVIPNGVDTQKFAPAPDVTTIRHNLGIGPTDPVVGIIAALRPEKNHELFLEMASRVVQVLPTSKFLIVGDGPKRSELEARANELKIHDNVLFVGSRSDVPQLLAAIDVFALTSHIEANPISILEAMSVGKPVVATNVGSIHEAVAEGRTGHLVTPGDAYQFADRVTRLLNAPLTRQTMGAIAREMVTHRWSMETMVGGYEHLIETIYARKTLTTKV